MKFEVNRKDFIDAMAAAAKATAGKQMAILGNIHITAAEGCVELLGYNLQLAVFAVTPAAVAEPGEALISATSVSNFLSKCAETTAIIAADCENVTVKCGRSKVTLLSPPVCDYPALKRLDAQDSEMRIKAGQLRTAVGSVIYAAADSSSRTSLQAVNLNFDNGVLEFIGCDGYRAASCRYAAEDIKTRHSFNVIKSDLKTALSLVDGSDIAIRYNNKEIEFVGEDGTAVRTRLCAEAYPEVGQMISRSFAEVKQTVQISSEELRDVLNRLLALPKETPEAPARLSFSENELTIIYDFKSGQFVDKVRCELNGEPLTVGIRASFLMEAIRGTEDELSIGCNGSNGALTIEKDGVRRIIMPMRLRTRNGL